MPIMHENYYEGILQLRNSSKEIIDYIDSEMARRENVLINKIKKVKDGFDFYFTDQRYLQGIGKRLQQKFGGELKVSQKLFTKNRMTGKEVYRVTVLFRCYNLKNGTVKDYRGDKVKIIKLGKDKVTVKDMKTGKKMFLSYGDLG
ncbi:MAG: NMD3-related protein [Candidatus Woesearchaeota archaeon]